MDKTLKCCTVQISATEQHFVYIATTDKTFTCLGDLLAVPFMSHSSETRVKLKV